jgi:hypothetical protein
MRKVSLSQIIEELGSGEPPVAKVVARALEVSRPEYNVMWHPLGFIHVKFVDARFANWRLHLWPLRGNPQKPFFEMHNHIFDLSSLVIAGKLENTTYAIDGDSQATHSIYEVRYTASGSTLARTQCPVRCRLDSRATKKAGQTYGIKRGTFHSTRRLGGNAAISFVTMSNTVSTPPLVLGQLRGDQRYEYVRRPVTKKELATVLDEISGST